MEVKIKTALISVSDKSGVVDFAKKLSKMGVKIISTGGTAKKLSDAGIDVVGIESVTGFPEMMNGRVKTLHPKIHGALLGLRDKKDRRVIHIRLTLKGKKILRRLKLTRKKAIQAAFRKLTNKERRTYLTILRKVLAALH